jgi:hypothetical protein
VDQATATTATSNAYVPYPETVFSPATPACELPGTKNDETCQTTQTSPTITLDANAESPSWSAG